MFRPRHRRHPFADSLNWADYRWDTGPWHHGGAASASQHGRHSRQRSHPFLLLLIAGVAAVVGAKLLSSLQSSNTSWARRGLYAALLVLIVRAFSSNRRHRWW